MRAVSYSPALEDVAFCEQGIQLNMLFSLLALFWLAVSCGLLVHAPQIRTLQIKLLERRLSVYGMVCFVMLLTLFYEIYQVIAYRALAMVGGE